MTMNIIGRHKLFLGIGCALVAVSWMFVFAFGLRTGVDIAGGVEWRVGFQSAAEPQAVRETLTALGVEAQVTRAGDHLVIRAGEFGLAERAEYETALRENFGAFETLGFSSVGPAVGREAWRRSLTALGGVLIVIALYVAWAFRGVSYRIPSWQYGGVAIMVLIHDVSIPLGAAALLGRLGVFSFDTTVVTALLVVLGYSVNDTLVVFDRMREYFSDERRRGLPLSDVMNRSVQETLPRSLNTSGTTVAALVALLAFGPAGLLPFLLTALFGIVAGTASSLYLAPPLLYLFRKKS